MFRVLGCIKTPARPVSTWRPFAKAKDKFEGAGHGKLLYPRPGGGQSNVTRLWDGIKKNLFSDSKNPDEEVENYFKFSVEKLMESPGRFTFQTFAKYLEELCKKLRLIGRRPMPEDQVTGMLLQLRNQHKMMAFLTPEELASDAHTVFTHETKRILADAAGLTLKDVDDMLLHHDMCKTDRTWYLRRMVLGRKLPTSHREREFLAFQRPSVRLAQQLYPRVDSPEVAQIRKLHEDVHYRRTRTRTWPWFRHRTRGHDYWRTRPFTKLPRR